MARTSREINYLLKSINIRNGTRIRLEAAFHGIELPEIKEKESEESMSPEEQKKLDDQIKKSLERKMKEMEARKQKNG